MCRMPDARWTHVLSLRKQPLSSDPISSALVSSSLVLLANQVNITQYSLQHPYTLSL
jgi:hypothetical protein